MRLSAALALTAAVAFSACNCTPAQSKDAGVQDSGVVTVDDAGFDAGVMEPPDAGEPDAGPPPMLSITALLPPRGASAGGTSVLISGSAFLHDFAGSGTEAKPNTVIKIGGNQVQDFQIIDDETIELRTPPGVTGPASVSLQNPNGGFVCNNCFTYFDELSVTGFTPRQGVLSGGNEVVITGTGFTADTQVLFGAYSSPHIAFDSVTQLTVTAPRGAAVGPVDLVVYNKNGVSTQRRGYTYVADLRVSSVSPPTGPLAGGTTVTLTGTGFTGATAVKFGGTDGTGLSVVSDTELLVASPAGTAGAVDVTVVTPGGTWTVKKGFTYFDAGGAFAVFALTPHVVQAGDVVTLTGQALDTGTLSVSIGGVAATVGAVTFSTAQLTVPARGAAPRRADVTVDNGTDTATLAQGATWRVALESLTPNSGPSAGGTVVTLAAQAFPDAAALTVGTLAATNVTVTSETSVGFTTPAGSGGAASDLHVSEVGDPENEATLAGAFTFLEPLSIGRVQPERGAIAGNTLVTVLGSGFGDSTVALFGANNAKDVKLVDSHTITCRTPKGAVGVVDVKVRRLTETDTLPGGFSYFDPRSISGGMSGGPLVGTLNITVLDSTQGSYGAPVPGATVVLGLDANTPFQGLTDARGQITFSDPTLVKAQTVTVFKDFYQSATVTGVNAENLTVYVARTGGGEPGSGMPPPGTPASEISGRVTGFKSPRALGSGESLEARVFVAQTSLFAGPPLGGLPNKSFDTWKLAKDGDGYHVYTGAGLRATYAILGIKSGNAFTPVAMGVKRGITTSPDNPAVNQDIVIDTLLDQTVPVTIDSPLSYADPLNPLDPQQPATNAIYSWLALGAEGFIPNPNNWDTGTAYESLVSSTSASLSMPNLPRLDGANFIFLNEAKPSSFYPVSYYFRRQPGDLTQGITIGPMLPGPVITEPSMATGQFTGTLSWDVAPGPTPDIHDVQIIRPSLVGSVVVWEVVLPGSETSVVLPQSAVDKLRREEQGNGLFLVIYSSRSPRFAYNQWTYDSLSGLTWSSFTISQSGGFSP